jgi:heptosyltransferase-2
MSPRTHEPPRELLVVLPNWVGDAVMATPVLRALREHFPHSRITYLGRNVVLDLLDGAPWCNAVIADNCGPGLRAIMRLARRLRPAQFDLAVLLPNSFRSALIAKLGRAKRRVGYSRDGRGWLLTDRLAPPRDERGRLKPTPTLDYYRRLVQSIEVPCESPAMELPLRDADAQAADALLAQSGHDPARPLVMLNPGASFGPSKMWEPARYAALGDALVRVRNAQIIINAAPSERGIAAAVARRMAAPPLVSFADRDNTLGLLKGLLRRCDLLVTNDTGPRHVAAALGIGVVTIFGSTDPVWAHTGHPRERTVRVAAPCSPCQQKLCPQIPGPAYHQCMSAITVDAVLACALDLLAPRTSPAEAAT